MMTSNKTTKKKASARASRKMKRRKPESREPKPSATAPRKKTAYPVGATHKTKRKSPDPMFAKPRKPQGLGASGRQTAPATSDAEFRQLRQAFHDLLQEEELRHSRLVADLEASRTRIQDTQAELENAYAELTAANAEMRATLKDRDDAYRELFEREAASQELIETAAQGVIVVDAQERITRMNQVACRMFGYLRDELLGQQLNKLVPKSSRKTHSREVARFFRRPRRRLMGRGRTLTGCRKDGSSFSIQVGLSSVKFGNQRHAVAFISDVSEQQRTEKELQEKEERLRRLANQVTYAAEQQNRKWAQELHDVYSQRVASIAIGLSQVALAVGGGKQLQLLEEKVQDLARDMHSLSRRLHPTILHDLGLTAALKSEAAQFEREHGVKTQVKVSNIPNLSGDVALCLYRVAQESLRNIHKHSSAQHVHIKAQGTRRTLTLTVEDLGDGFELERALRKGGLGIISMEERVASVGGKLSILSAPGKGTCVQAKIPLHPAGRRERG